MAVPGDQRIYAGFQQRGPDHGGSLDLVGHHHVRPNAAEQGDQVAQTGVEPSPVQGNRRYGRRQNDELSSFTVHSPSHLSGRNRASMDAHSDMITAEQAADDLAAEIAYWREVRGLSKKALAEPMGFYPSYISHIESGRHKPSEDFARRADEAVNAGKL